jgi:iron complex outermembrane receptor protein
MVGIQDKQDKTQQEIDMGSFKKRPVAIALVGVLATYAQLAAQAQTADADQIVVTANKVSQSALKVGASLSAISADDIRDKGVTDAKSLTDLMPNTQISQAGNSSVVVNIRGIENTNTTTLGDPAAAFHIDGVYLGRMSGAGAAFYDIERVEVLRGPQGTLYGRNANAGVVNVITKGPSNKLEGYVGVEVGNLGQKRVDGMFNLPVNDALALRAAFSSNRRDGFSETKTSTNGFRQNQDSINTDSVRLQALLKFSSSTRLNLSYDESTNKATGPNYYNLAGGIPTKLVDTSTMIQGRFDNKMNGFKAELSTDVGFANLNYIYGNRGTKTKEDYSTGPLLLLTKFKVEQSSHELRFSSKDVKAPLQWVAGYFNFKETGTDGQLDGNAPFYLFGPAAPGPAPFGPSQCGGFVACYPALQYQDRLVTNASDAFFGQVSYSIAPSDRVILGARTTQDKKSRDGTQVFAFNGTNYSATGNGVTPLFGQATWKSATYKLGYEKDLSASEMSYATISTGFKSGGFNDGNTRTNPELIFRPEKITAYEAGLNGKYLGNALQLTSSIFHYDYTDMQKSGVVNSSMLTVNTGSATVDGAEVSARYRVSKAGRFDASLGLLKAKYKVYTTPNGSNFSGKALDKTPSVTLNLGYAHNWNLESGSRLTAYAGTKYSASYVTTDTGTPTAAPIQFKQKAFTKSNLSLTYANAEDSMDVQLYVKNIENKSQLMGSVAFFGGNYGYMSEPRTVGIRSNFRF